MLQIKEKENLILKACRETSAKIYIYGAGKMGKKLADELLSQHILIAGFLVDYQFWKTGETYKDIPIFCMDDIKIDKNIMVIPAIEELDETKIENLKEKTTVIVMDLSFSWRRQETFDYVFWKENETEFEKLYERLADDKSRNHMEAYLNQKMSCDYKYLDNVWEENQYYDNDIIDFSRVESFVDCGAYDGDTYQAFRENYRRCTGKEYDGKAYLFEPDSYENCLLNCGSDKRCKIFRLGVWDKEDKLTFSVQGTGSSVSEEGNVTIYVDSIDHILGGGQSGLHQDGYRGQRAKSIERSRGNYSDIQANFSNLRVS